MVDLLQKHLFTGVFQNFWNFQKNEHFLPLIHKRLYEYQQDRRKFSDIEGGKSTKSINSFREVKIA